MPKVKQEKQKKKEICSKKVPQKGVKCAVADVVRTVHVAHTHFASDSRFRKYYTKFLCWICYAHDFSPVWGERCAP
jgi:hypothetical protein